MSYRNSLPGLLSADGLDTTLAKLGIVASVLLLGLRLLSDQVLLVVIPVAVGVPCLLYFGVHRRPAASVGYPVLPKHVIGYLPSAVVLGLAVLVVAISTAGHRTLPIYLLTGAIGAGILIQTLLIDTEELSPTLILSQILVSAVVIRLSALFVTPGFVGVDIWTHVPVFIGGIVESGSLSAIAESKYSMSPFYHTLGAVGALVFGSARVGVYLSIGLLVPLSALLVYASGTLLVSNRWALVATVVFAFADQFIRWGFHLIPTSLGLVFFLGAVYCVTRFCFSHDSWLLGVLLAISLAMVFTHQVSTAILLVFLGIATAAFASVNLLGVGSNQPTSRSVTGLAVVFLTTLSVTVVSWAMTPWIGEDPFLYEMTEILQAAVVGEAGFLNLASGAENGGGGGTETVGIIAELLPFIEWLGFALLFAAAIFGGLAMLRENYPTTVTLTYILSSASMFIIVFGFSFFGVRAILPGRWMAFMYALLAIMAAVGLAHLSGIASKRVVLAVFVLLALSYPMSMVVAEKATLDSPAFESENPRFAYTASEIAAVETIRTIYPPGEARNIDSDHPYQTLFERLGGYTGHTAEIDDSGPTANRPFVSRQYQLQGPTVVQETGDPLRSVFTRNVAPERLCSPTRNHVYTNDLVKMCSPSPVTGGPA